MLDNHSRRGALTLAATSVPVLLHVIATSLRLRLILAFSVLVGLVLFVGVVSYGVNEQVHSSVDRLRPSERIDVSGIDFERQGLEFEGYWNPAGAFIATQVTPEPAELRPKLRGPILEVKSDPRAIVMYGRTILVTPDTRGDEGAGGRDKPLVFAALQPGVRAEASCAVDAATGVWTARQIELTDIKSSNKVKGMVTKAELDGEAPEVVEIHGLRIVLQAIKESGPESALGRIEQATAMLAALQKCRATAHAAVDFGRPETEPPLTDTAEAARDMDREAARFQQQLADARSAGADPTMVPAGQFVQYLDDMARNVGTLQQHIRELQQRIASGDRTEALQYLSSELEPCLDDELLPFVYAYLNKADEELADELRGVLDRTRTTTRVALATSVVAVLVALALGAMVWRSIHRPIRQLHDAAVALGQGRLDTRIAIRSSDEFGVLAGAFNSMAGQLAATTVSVAGLESMFDSMAAGVILCDQGGTVTNVNRAARDLVVRASGELVGQPFTRICRLGDGERIATMVAASTAAGGSMERSFVRKDGSELPVSVSVAELRTTDDALQGYVVVAQDLTPIKHIEAQLRESLAEKELLLREVHHRVKNNMQVISSLLAMQSSAGDPEVRQRLEESQNRIRTIALIHEQLYQSTEVAHIDTRSYLNVLATHLLQSFGKADTVRLDLDIEPMNLDLDQSLACGLIVNELLTNSFKYAFPGDRRGNIRLCLKQQADGTRLLEVQDDGRGFVAPDPALAAAPRRKTLGTSLVAKLARQLRGKVEVDGSNGMRTRIVFAGTQPAAAVTS